MSYDDRIEALRSKHHGLEEELKQETQRPMPDSAAIAKIKREKLRLKDEIARLEKL